MEKTFSQRLLEALKENPGITIKELATLLSANASRVKATTYRLKSLGYVEKVGKGYVITDRGLKFLEHVQKLKFRTGVSKGGDTTSNHEKSLIVECKPPFTEKPATDLQQQQLDTNALHAVNSIFEKLKEIEKRLLLLEAQVKSLERAITTMQKKPEITRVPEAPVMHYNEAVLKHGPTIDKMLDEKRLIRVGSLVVDAEFYTLFRSKFPIKLVDVDKLLPQERLLLEEMRREALVVLYSGKEYRLVE